ncbi:hypothetical protein BV25DRAFT_1330085 [Artomyces pyxidatus]|uniref:Uncharacterized protein n=1 Tax=Artomyces pyxidatus TaxID=48021 RepID=A0ACB8SQ48_9AGAM|nr:hypothetical protein BV25DRAFT_1330085 [Artomyces pyxidatus]
MSAARGRKYAVFGSLDQPEPGSHGREQHTVHTSSASRQSLNHDIYPSGSLQRQSGPRGQHAQGHMRSQDRKLKQSTSQASLLPRQPVPYSPSDVSVQMPTPEPYMGPQVAQSPYYGFQYHQPPFYAAPSPDTHTERWSGGFIVPPPAYHPQPYLPWQAEMPMPAPGPHVSVFGNMSMHAYQMPVTVSSANAQYWPPIEEYQQQSSEPLPSYDDSTDNSDAHRNCDCEECDN